VVRRAENAAGQPTIVLSEQTEVCEEKTIGGEISSDYLPSKPRWDQVGRYVILDRLGMGGMGEVFRAYDPELDRKVAIKVFLEDLREDQDPSYSTQERLSEARAVARLSHPNIVPIYDVGVHDGCVFLALELVEGATLRSKMREKPEPNDETRLDWLMQCAQGLAAVHRANLVHGDFKPENAIVGVDGIVRILDFGLARTVTSERGSALATSRDGDENGPSAIFGTLNYLSAAQIHGSPASPSSDLFAWGVTLHEIVTHARPFRGENARELARDQELAGYRQRRAFRRLDGWLRQLIDESLAPIGGPTDLNLETCAERIRAGLARRNHKWLGVASLFVVSTLVAGLSFRPQAQNETCSVELGSAGVGWSDAQAQRVEHAFAATQISLAANAFRRVDAEYRAWRESWTTAVSEFCRASSGEASSESLLIRSSQRNCLLANVRAARSLSELLAHADKEMIEKSINAVQTLPSPAKCLLVSDQNDGLLAGLPAPEQEAIRNGDEALSEALLMATMGRPIAAKEAFDKVYATMEEVEWPPLLVKARTVEAGLAFEKWDHGRSWKLANQALFAAQAMDRMNLVRAAAVAQLNPAGYMLSDRVELEEMQRNIAAIDARAGADLFAQAQTQLALVRFLLHADLNEGAELAGTRGLALLDRMPDSPESRHLRANLLINLGGTRASLRRSAEGEADSLAALRILESEFGTDHPALANPLWNAALANLNAGRFERADFYALRGQRLLEDMDGPWTQRAVPFYHYRLDLLRGLGLFATAAEMYQHVVPLYQKNFGVNHIRPFGMMGDQAIALLHGGRLRESTAIFGALHGLARRMSDNLPVISRFADFQIRAALVLGHRQYAAELVKNWHEMAQLDPTVLRPSWLWARLEVALDAGDGESFRRSAAEISGLDKGILASRMIDIGDALVRGFLALQAPDEAARVVARYAELLAMDASPRDPREIWLARWRSELALFGEERERALRFARESVVLANRYRDEVSLLEIAEVCARYRRLAANADARDEPTMELINALEAQADRRRESKTELPVDFFEPIVLR
jgi:serine/threonine protein kinase